MCYQVVNVGDSISSDDSQDSISEENSDTNDRENSTTSSSNFRDRYIWQRHSSGIASKLMNKMGYGGLGLGKEENGITEPIVSEPRGLGEPKEKRQTICILSDSILNRLDEKRLSNENFNVKTQYHGGCTVQCMYSHLPWAFQHLPNHIILHVGTNDCSRKTSDEVIKELLNMKICIKKVLPACKIWFSLPTVRTDSSGSNVIIRNLNKKLKKLCDTLLENSNINEQDLSKKGLHLNERGNKKMAGNIIALIKRL